jgi:hypothetical protein
MTAPSAAYLDAWVGLANMPGVSERSVAEQAAQRLDKAWAAHLAVVSPEPGPYEFHLTEDPGMTWEEFKAELEAEVS